MNLSRVLAETEERHFEYRSWRDILDDASTSPAWLTLYANSRGLYRR